MVVLDTWHFTQDDKGFSVLLSRFPSAFAASGPCSINQIAQKEILMGTQEGRRVQVRFKFI